MSCEYNYNGRIIVPENTSSEKEVIKFRGIKPIHIEDKMEGDVRVIEISYKPYVGFTLVGSASPSVLEVGQLSSVIFKGDITPGNEDVVTYATNPVEDYVVTGNSVSVTKSITSTTKVNISQQISVTDAEGTTKSVSPTVKVQHRYIIGTMERDTNTVIQGESKLADNIQSAYGELRDYTIPVSQHHLIWLIPDGESMGVVTDSNGFECETIDGGNHSITNEYGVVINYKIIKTKNFFHGGAGVAIKLKF
jgi:hypothetical protein